MRNSSNVIFTLLVTALIGILAGFLLAPQSGRRTRKRLLKKARKINEDIQDLAFNSGETIKDVKDSLIDFTDAAGYKFEKLLKKSRG
jgi:gas vesicle protein